MAFNVEIKTLAPAQALTVDHRGSYMEIGKAFERLFGILGQRGQIRPDMRMIALYYDDPAQVAETELRSKAGVIPATAMPAEAPLAAVDVQGGRYAILHYRGPYADMRHAYEWLFATWLAQSGEAAADAPAFEEYLNTPMDTAPQDLLTEICLPLR